MTTYEPEILVERANERGVTIYLKSGSAAELDRADFMKSDIEDFIDFELQVPILWFARIRSKVESVGDGTFLMERVCHHADCLRASIVNEINPYGRMNLKELIAWFGKFGFQDVGNGMVIRRPNYADA